MLVILLKQLLLLNKIMKNRKDDIYFVFDVESEGVHGAGFAVSAVVVDYKNRILERQRPYVCPISDKCSSEDKEWLEKNVLPALEVTGYIQQPNGYYLRQVFWERICFWKGQGAEIWSDCCYPVETNFLSACVADSPKERASQAPYPLLDLSGVLKKAGLDPIGTYGRLESEFPAHNPLMDSMQSARILTSVLNDDYSFLDS